jgi:CheY-like chemotaxis protein
MQKPLRRVVPRILVVDDNPDVRETVTAVLEAEGYRVECAENGAQALVALHHGIPNAVLLDLIMPVMSGWELLQIVREDERWSKIPIIVLSAVRSPEGLPHLSKPIGVQELLDALERAAPRAPAPPAEA